jgi:2'-5' RNA ligase
MQQTGPEIRGLVVLFPEEVGVEIDKWRRIYDPRYQMVPPHITVAYPPFVPEKEWPLVRPALVECLSRFQPFRIHLEELGAFAGSPHVLWLKPEDDGNLMRIHAALEERFAQYVPASPFDYIPHVTIGAFHSEEELFRAQEAILSEWKPCHSHVNELVYMSSDNDGVWCVCTRLPLGQPLASA